jgi:hypothetical protein
MYPWLWFWAPRFQFPFSGAMSQWVEPDTNWFFSAIQPQSGNGELEKKIFDVASYGRQLGRITDVLLSLASPDAIKPEDAHKSLAELRKDYRNIEALKSEHKKQLSQEAIALLEKLRATDPEELRRLLVKFSSE